MIGELTKQKETKVRSESLDPGDHEGLIRGKEDMDPGESEMNYDEEDPIECSEMIMEQRGATSLGDY